MLSFLNRKKSLVEVNFFEGFRDCHSHILPGVDDGARTLEESLAILSWLEELGTASITLTPHIMDRYPQNSADSLSISFSKFQESYSGGVELRLGAEYMLDSSFANHLKHPQPLTIDGHNHLLVEMSFASAPINLFSTLDAIMSNGFFVVLAHPERYLFLERRDYIRLKDIGVKFQLNVLSLLGGYGRDVQQRTRELMALSIYNIIGSDIHALASYKNIIEGARLSPKDILYILSLRESFGVF